MNDLFIEGDTTIRIVRGDSKSIPLQFELDDGSILPFSEGDIVYLTVKDNPYTEDKQMQITVTEFTDNTAYINIRPEDTKKLKYKTYVYDLQVTRVDGTVTTLIPASDFVVGEEVTYE